MEKLTQSDGSPISVSNTTVKLCAELETCRAHFHALLGAVSPAEWRAARPFGQWTVAEQFFHMAQALELLPKEIEAARQGKGMLNLPHWLRIGAATC